MLKRLGRWLRRFFFPPAEASLGIRILPYAVLGALTLVVLVSSAYAWDYTNSPQFCGTVCHTMPPEYTAYLTSPHARVDCVECHIGRGFIATRVTRKAGDIKHIISLAFHQYEFPIRADELRPARETCERCHFPEKFSDDSLREVRRYRPDRSNTPMSIYLTMKTGGGSQRQGLGRGIHWHIENPVYYLAADPEEQLIPFVRVLAADGTVTEYVDIEAGLDPASIDASQLKQMDCITCHNRITHQILPPEDTVDQLLARKVISSTIPEIRLKAVEVFRDDYPSQPVAMNGIAGLDGYYRVAYPDFYQDNQELIQQAIQALQQSYLGSVFPEQKASWTSHPDNVGHKDSPGCFRCHDGKHLNAQQAPIRLECNLCHSIPVVAGPSDFVAEIEISRGPEPASHLNPNWIGLHREAFNPTCENCHSTQNAGGTDDSSFCSNSACHGSAWVYAGFDAPGLREILQAQLPQVAQEPTPELGSPTLTYVGSIGGLLQSRCGGCHGDGGIQGLNLTAYSTALQGGASGPVIVPGDPEGSLLVQKQTAGQPHYGQLNEEELGWVIEWIAAGAPER
jgi:nitrate/TMAO reductase-like tetraheme cytochrome c subunit